MTFTGLSDQASAARSNPTDQDDAGDPEGAQGQPELPAGSRFRSGMTLSNLRDSSLEETRRQQPSQREDCGNRAEDDALERSLENRQSGEHRRDDGAHRNDSAHEADVTRQFAECRKSHSIATTTSWITDSVCTRAESTFV